MLKVVTYNIECGLQKNQLLENVTALKNENVDIFCFQEIVKYQGKDFIGDAFLELLGVDWKAEYYSMPEYGTVGLSLGIFWNSKVLEIKDVDKILLPRLENLRLWERVFLKGVFGHIEYSNWLAYFFSGKKLPVVDRGVLVATFKLKEKFLRVSSLHIDWAGKFQQRAKQISHLVQMLNKKPKVDMELICGDFNTLGTPLNFEKRSQKLLELFPIGFRDSLVKIVPTSKLFLRLDYIFVKGFAKYFCKVLPWKGSDHRPLIVELEE